MLESLFLLQTASEQMARANHAQTTGELASRTANDVRLENQTLRAEVEKLYLITAAMWALLKETQGLTDEALARRMAQVDAADGTVDGRVTPGEPKSCGHCGRKLTKRKPLCLYCGATVRREIFDR